MKRTLSVILSAVMAALLISEFGGPGFTNDMLLERILGGADPDAITSSLHIGPMLDAYGAFTYGGQIPPEPVEDYEVQGLGGSIAFEWTVTADEDNGKDGFWFVELLDKNGNHVDSITAGGKLRANIYCNFDLTVTAATYSDTCSVVVGGDVTEITLPDELTVKVGEQKVVTPQFTPLDGVVENGKWEIVSGNGVVSVDYNGIVTGIKEGTAVVRYVAENSQGEEIKHNAMTVTVSAGLSSYGNIISSHRSRFPLSEIGVDASKVDTENSVGFTLSDAGELIFDGGAERAVVVFAGEEDVLIINLVSENDIEIVESGVLDDYVLEVRGEPLYLTARYASVFRRGDPVDVTWSVSDEEVATVDADGVVKGITSGNITVTAQAVVHR